MIRKLDFKDYNGNAIELFWDTEQGTLSGRDAIEVLDACLTAYKIGGITVRPLFVPIKRDPLKNMAEMAAVLLHVFPSLELPKEFSAAFLSIRPERVEPPVPEGEGWGPFYS